MHFDPHESLVFLTNRVGRLLGNKIRRRLGQDEQDLLSAHMGVLVDLWVKDGIRQQDLAISVIKDKGTIARALDVMERENILVRIPDEQDKRNKRIYLTHKGKELKERLMPHAHEVVAEATGGLTTEEVNTCKKVLLRMYENLR